jgi:Protein of unknown function (DUF2934)
MATRRTTKTQSRHQQAPEPEEIVAIVLPNGDSTMASPDGNNGPSPSFDQIQRRAYELFVARGASDGCDWADWFTAEQELIAVSAAAH